MAPLPVFPLPLPANCPPSGFGWEEREMSELSTTTAFNTGINQRDTFLGWPRCVICGDHGGRHGRLLKHCHICRQSEPGTWSELRDRNWIPHASKAAPEHEPRDGLLMCRSHHAYFDDYDFYIRFVPDTRRFVFVNFSDSPSLQMFHGKAIALDTQHRYAPFPSLFIIHEMRVRGFHPFQPIIPIMPDDIHWQDWIVADGVFNNVTGTFNHDSPPDNGNNRSVQPLLRFQPGTTTTGATSSGGGRALPLNPDVIEDILAATRAMPSWRACQMENTSWSGTAQENIQKYVSSVGVQGR